MAAGENWPSEVWDEILDRLSKGETLTGICRTEGFPCRKTVHKVKNENAEFGLQFARAKDLGFDAIAEDSLKIVDDANPESVQVAKLRAEHRLKLLAKWDPKRYGDKVTTEHTGANGGAIETITRIELVAPSLDGDVSR